MKHILILVLISLLSLSLFSCQSNKIPILNNLATIEAIVSKANLKNNRFESNIDVVLKANLSLVNPQTTYPKLVKGSKAYLTYNPEAQIENITCKPNVICTFTNEYIVIEYYDGLAFVTITHSVQVKSKNKNVVISSIKVVEPSLISI